jgi:hypothetical protein
MRKRNKAKIRSYAQGKQLQMVQDALGRIQRLALLNLIFPRRHNDARLLCYRILAVIGLTITVFEFIKEKKDYKLKLPCFLSLCSYHQLHFFLPVIDPLI